MPPPDGAAPPEGAPPPDGAPPPAGAPPPDGAAGVGIGSARRRRSRSRRAVVGAPRAGWRGAAPRHRPLPAPVALGQGLVGLLGLSRMTPERSPRAAPGGGPERRATPWQSQRYTADGLLRSLVQLEPSASARLQTRSGLCSWLVCSLRASSIDDLLARSVCSPRPWLLFLPGLCLVGEMDSNCTARSFNQVLMRAKAMSAASAAEPSQFDASECRT